MVSYLTIEGFGKFNLCMVLVHGATMGPFKEGDLLVEKLKPICKSIYSIILPGHASSKLKSSEILDFGEALSDFSSTIKIICKENEDYKIGFLGLSLGGLMGLQVNFEFDFCIFVGCGNTFTKESLQRISWFFSEDTYKRFKLDINMKKLHGEYWNYLLKSIKLWFSNESVMITKPIIHLQSPAIFILAENDQPFNPKSIQFDHDIPIKIVPGDHFSYFSSKVISHTFTIIEDFVLDQLN